MKPFFKSYYFLVLIFLFLILGINALSYFVILFMVLISVIVGMYRYFIPFNLGLELITFFSVLISFSISPFVGWIFAITVILLSHILTHNLCIFIIVKIGVYGAICVLAWALSGLGIVSLGIILTIVKNIIFAGITFLLNPGKGTIDLPSNFLNVALNAYLFVSFANFFLGSLA